MARVKQIGYGLCGALFLLANVSTTALAGCDNSWVLPRLVAGDFGGVSLVPRLNFKNLSSKNCTGRLLILEGDSEPAAGQFDFDGQAVLDGMIEVQLAPGEGRFAKLEKIDSGRFEGFGIWRLDDGCVASLDAVLTADLQISEALSPEGYRVIDQIGLGSSAVPHQSWGFPVRKFTPSHLGAIEETGFSVAPCETGPYEWRVEYFDNTGFGQLARQGTSTGPMAKLIGELFTADLASDFEGYVTVSVDKPAFLEALAVVWGPRVQGGLQLSNFPIQVGAGSPFTQHTAGERLQEALDQAVKLYGIVGSTVAVSMPGQPIWTGTSGLSTPTEPISESMLFGIASITKSFMAALVLQLVDEGVLRLEDPLSRWLPDFPNIDPTITVQQLLNHTSGLHNYEFDPRAVEALFGQPDRCWTPEEILGFVDAPTFAPGSSWAYSNTNYILVGMIARASTGSEVSAELRRRFFSPLGLTKSYLPIEESPLGALAHNWSDWDRDGQYQDISTIINSLYSLAWTTGGLVSSPKDVVRWAKLLFEGKILSEDRLSEMLDFVPLVPPTNGITGYGLGVQEFRLNGHVFWGHGGNMPGWSSMMLYEPSTKVSIAVLFNQDNVAYEPSAALIEAILGALPVSDF